ncbi:hypothetical protein VQH23_09155 [Pararoseomonas sp. SCSIO 73927]|uniref:hypothetical protein n=1 Tax=Pararoseomonas sp. SCSIO 73927 TaxID=3114537 RepID=UPI0030CC6C93
MRVMFLAATAIMALMAGAGGQPARPASAPPPPGGAAVAGIPRFENFPATAGPPARTAPLILTPPDRRYRTRLRAAAAERPNFAGHYVLTTWGCGTECVYGAAVNLRTGRVTFLPFTTCCFSEAPEGTEEMVAFRQDSSLLVLLGMTDERGTDIGAHYYRIQGDRLVHLRSVPFPPRRWETP